MSSRFPDDAEWLEANGLGGFASGTVSGRRTRRYHALLLAARTPPIERFVLVNGLDAYVESAAGRFALSCQRYTPDVVHPDGVERIEDFSLEPWPTWTFRLDDGTRIRQEVLARHGAPLVALRWRVVDAAPHDGNANDAADREGTAAAASGGAPRRAPLRLTVRLFMSGRDYHALQRENAGFRFAPDVAGERLTWRPYDGVPAVTVTTNGTYQHAPEWYRNFLYTEERARGLDCVEDLAAPGVFTWDLAAGDAICLLRADTPADVGSTDAVDGVGEHADVALLFAAVHDAEAMRRCAFASSLERAADAYVVRRGNGRTIIAGYPWFTDWGRDTFIALRGLCIATGRIDEAREILIAWAGTVSDGMVPNRFPDHGEAPDYNAVDAALWFVVAVGDLARAAAARGTPLSACDRAAFDAAIEAILDGYARGTRYGIRVDDDGLVAAGVPGVQLTWMDAKVGDWVVTPRIGKPVEVQALWLNALAGAAAASERWRSLFERGRESFAARFWNESGGHLYDVVDVDHVAGTVDAAFRPNQIFAVGGLPLTLLDPLRARRMVDAVEARLVTPLGPRSLAPDDPAYVPRYEGDARARDGAYHRGTVWPWLAGAFVEAWVRVRGSTRAARREAHRRFVLPLRAHLDTAGLGHVSEIADGDPPHTPRGCPFQAWSLGELLRLERVVLTDAADDDDAPASASDAIVGATSTRRRA